ncbi:hypothetical protein IBL26_17720 [Roseomonas aerophila]|uniref:DUF6311 domain-containing protein n=1 Tax=Teichococcus aerophilus TaxID=1224513 RepID=A0ABR7RQS6_9PROT|nr:DUF6311 domain-containing protein [Pseudoroseomonas aerophila]MBC9208693.1 hypothetical protein [Pseudoroseomonas aerophila]
MTTKDTPIPAIPTGSVAPSTPTAITGGPPAAIPASPNPTSGIGTTAAGATLALGRGTTGSIGTNGVTAGGPTGGAGAARRGRLEAYGIGLLLGLLMVGWLLPAEVLSGQGGLWRSAGVDLSQNLSGHLAYQSGPWHWPLLVSGNLFPPHGLSIAMTDSNPLLSLVARIVVAPLAGHPVNLFGAWIALCWLLQPVAAIYAVRGFTPPALPRGRALAIAAAAAAMALLWPTLLHRLGHTNLLAHFCLLAALGLAARALRDGTPLRFWPGFALLAATILIHPYLFLFAGAVLAAPVLRPQPGGWRGLLRPGATFLAMLVLPVLLHRLLSGTSGGADRGYGFYSMNLLSPLWPQVSGLFGADLPVLDATGGQYEGFNYLGAGTLLLVLLALILGWRRGWLGGWRRWAPLLAVLASLTAVAVTPRLYAGPWLILPLPAWPWDQVFGIVRASGRVFWPVGYALLLGAIALLGTRLPLRALAPALALAVALQAADAAPLLGEVRNRLAQGDAGLTPLPTLPPGTTLLRTALACPATAADTTLAERLRLAAVQQGAALAEIRASRQPRWFNCETALTDALETPLAPGETRLLLGPAIALLRPAALGPGATCVRQPNAGADAVFCATTPHLPGTPLPATAPLPRLGAAPVLASSWKPDAHGLPWSEGPRATLLFTTTAPRLRLTLDGIGRRPGEARDITLRIQDAPPLTLSLPDLQPTEILLPIPDPTRPVRVAIDIFRPIDPTRRALAAPVDRAGVRLRAISGVD